MGSIECVGVSVQCIWVISIGIVIIMSDQATEQMADWVVYSLRCAGTQRC